MTVDRDGHDDGLISAGATCIACGQRVTATGPGAMARVTERIQAHIAEHHPAVNA